MEPREAAVFNIIAHAILFTSRPEATPAKSAKNLAPCCCTLKSQVCINTQGACISRGTAGDSCFSLTGGNAGDVNFSQMYNGKETVGSK